MSVQKAIPNGTHLKNCAMKVVPPCISAKVFEIIAEGVIVDPPFREFPPVPKNAQVNKLFSKDGENGKRQVKSHLKHRVANYPVDQKICRHLEPRELIHYAAGMEEARYELVETLVWEPEWLLILIDEYFSRIEQGCDPTDLLTLKNGGQSPNAVQDDEIVQINIKQFDNELKMLFQQILPEIEKGNDLPQQTLEFVIQVHFLPAFLNLVAQRILKCSGFSEIRLDEVKSRLQRMNQARQLIVENNLGLVYFSANRYKHEKLSFSDVSHEGIIGLIKAVDRFDHKRPVMFSTYAIYWIRQTISRALVRQEKIVRLPFNIAARAAGVFQLMTSRLQKTGRWPDAYELAELSQSSVDEIDTILKFNQPYISLFGHVNDDESKPYLIETLEQDKFPSPYQQLSSNMLRRILTSAIGSLTEREADIIRRRFGIDTDNEMTLQDIAEQMKVSRERVRQIQNSALEKIRAQFGDELSIFLVPECE
ncbi:MAG: sigma-70 family RNA polymerase sigma factor [Gammaproteobacteria bacterium]